MAWLHGEEGNLRVLAHQPPDISGLPTTAPPPSQADGKWPIEHVHGLMEYRKGGGWGRVMGPFSVGSIPYQVFIYQDEPQRGSYLLARSRNRWGLWKDAHNSYIAPPPATCQSTWRGVSGAAVWGRKRRGWQARRPAHGPAPGQATPRQCNARDLSSINSFVFAMFMFCCLG